MTTRTSPSVDLLYWVIDDVSLDNLVFSTINTDFSENYFAY